MLHNWVERRELNDTPAWNTRRRCCVLMLALLLASPAASTYAAPPKPQDTEKLLQIIDSLLEEPLAATRGAAARATGAAPGLARSSSAGAHSGGPPQMDVPRRPEEHPVFGEWRGPKSDPPASPQGPKD